MSDVELVTNGIHNIFCHYKENQHRILIKALNDVQTCDGRHLAITQAVQDKMYWCRRMTFFYKLMMAIFGLLLFAAYAFILLQHYNKSKIYGGCSITFPWPLDECPVAY